MEQILDLIKEGNPEIIASYMKEHDLTIVDGKIVPKKEAEAKVKNQITFYDQRQQAR